MAERPQPTRHKKRQPSPINFCLRLFASATNTGHGTRTTIFFLPRFPHPLPIHRRPFRPSRPGKPRPRLRTIIRNLALRPRTRCRPPARRILRHLAHLHAPAARLRHRAVAITSAVAMRQEPSAIRPRAPAQQRNRRRERRRAQSRPLHYRHDRPPEGGPVHIPSLSRFRKKTDSSPSK